MDLESVNSENSSESRLSVSSWMPPQVERARNLSGHFVPKTAVLRDVTGLLNIGFSADTVNGKLSSITEEAALLETSGDRRVLSYRNGLRSLVSTCRLGGALSLSDCRIRTSEGNKFSRKGWVAMFKAGFLDQVNDSQRYYGDPGLLADLFHASDESREVFTRQLLWCNEGILFVDLRRKLDHVFFMTVELSSVLMFHPAAWGFPDADLVRIPLGHAGKERTVAHGWYAQERIRASMTQVTFAFTCARYTVPGRVVEAIAVGNVPEWLKQISELRADLSCLEKFVPDLGSNTLRQWDQASFLNSGLLNEREVYVKFSDLWNPGIAVSDKLQRDTEQYQVRGLTGLRLCLEERQVVTPKQVRAIVFQLGLGEQEYHWFWFGIYVLQYPLPQGWVAFTQGDVRKYMELSSGVCQSIHPLLPQFTAQLHHWIRNENLLPSSVRVPCDECGQPGAAVYCAQCVDNFCPSCFTKVHQKRGGVHLFHPLPGSRAAKLPFPRFNVGFCQAKRGADSKAQTRAFSCQCEWLHFSSDAFEAASEDSRSQFDLKHTTPPRLSGRRGLGFDYNFRTRVITEDCSAVVDLVERQDWAVIKLQAWARSVSVRMRLGRRSAACVRMQSAFRMFRAKKVCASKLAKKQAVRAWIYSFLANSRKAQVELGIVHMQALVRGMRERKFFAQKRALAVKVQAVFRSAVARRAVAEKQGAAGRIQKWVRGVAARRHLVQQCLAAVPIQARIRGIQVRVRMRRLHACILRIQSAFRGHLARRRLKSLHTAATAIQSSWRRHTSRLEFTQLLMTELKQLSGEYENLIRKRSAGLAAEAIQKTFRRHLARRRFVWMKQGRVATAKCVGVAVSALALSLGSLHLPLHPWFRYLSSEVQTKVLLQKRLVQTAIAREGFSLASGLLEAIFFKLLLPTLGGGKRMQEEALAWTNHGCVHLLANLGAVSGLDGKFDVVSSVNIADPKLLTFIKTASPSSESRLDRMLKLEDQNISTLVLKFGGQINAIDPLVLTTLREFLDQPQLTMDSNLAFQGMDAVAAARLLAVLGWELRAFLPPEWTGLLGKADAGQFSVALTSFYELKVHAKVGPPRNRDFGFRSFSAQAVFGLLRKTLRAAPLQGKLRDQLSCLISDTRNPLELSVVLFHVIVRGILSFELSTRAAQIIQVRFKYHQLHTMKRRMGRPATTIQRLWRGFSARVSLFRKDCAVRVIQSGIRACLTRIHNRKLMRSTSVIQSAWRGCILRAHLTACKTACILIQAVFRGHLVRLYIGSVRGRLVRREFLDRAMGWERNSAKFLNLRSEYLAQLELVKLESLRAKKSYARIVFGKVRRFRRGVWGRRNSIFEPPCFAKRRLTTSPPSGIPVANVIVNECNLLCRELQKEEWEVGNLHAAVRRGARLIRMREMKATSEIDDPHFPSTSTPSPESSSFLHACIFGFLVHSPNGQTVFGKSIPGIYHPLKELLRLVGDRVGKLMELVERCAHAADLVACILLVWMDGLAVLELAGKLARLLRVVVSKTLLLHQSTEEEIFVEQAAALCGVRVGPVAPSQPIAPNALPIQSTAWAAEVFGQVSRMDKVASRKSRYFLWDSAEVRAIGRAATALSGALKVRSNECGVLHAFAAVLISSVWRGQHFHPPPAWLTKLELSYSSVEKEDSLLSVPLTALVKVQARVRGWLVREKWPLFAALQRRRFRRRQKIISSPAAIPSGLNATKVAPNMTPPSVSTISQTLTTPTVEMVSSADNLACAKCFFVAAHTVWQRQLMGRMFSVLMSMLNEAIGMFLVLLDREPIHRLTLQQAALDVRMMKGVVRGKLKVDNLIRMDAMKKPVFAPKLAKLAVSKESHFSAYLITYLKTSGGDDSIFRDIPDDIGLPRTRTSAGSDLLAELQWLPLKAAKFAIVRAQLLAELRLEKSRKSFLDAELRGEFVRCVELLADSEGGSLNIFSSAAKNTSPLQTENVFHLLVGFVAQAVKSGNSQQGLALIEGAAESLPRLRVHEKHVACISALVFDTAIGFAYAFPDLCRHKVRDWFTLASGHYEELNHPNRGMKVVIRFGCVLSKLGLFHDAACVFRKIVGTVGGGNFAIVAKINEAVVAAIARSPEVADRAELRTAITRLRVGGVGR